MAVPRRKPEGFAVKRILGRCHGGYLVHVGLLGGRWPPLGGGTHGGITAAKNTREPPLVGGLVLILK